MKRSTKIIAGILVVISLAAVIIAMKEDNPCPTCEMSSPCISANQCHVPECQNEIATCHTVSKDCFEYLVKRAHGNSLPAEGEIHYDYQTFLGLSQVSCSDYRYVYTVAPQVTLTRANGHARPSNEINSFSVALFRGLVRTAGFHRIDFYKALDYKDNQKLAYKITDAQGNPLAHGDLSEAYPKK